MATGEDDVVLVPGGMEVKEDYRVLLPDGSLLSKQQSIVPITNYEHETYLIEVKRVISIPLQSLKL